MKNTFINQVWLTWVSEFSVFFQKNSQTNWHWKAIIFQFKIEQKFTHVEKSKDPFICTFHMICVYASSCLLSHVVVYLWYSFGKKKLQLILFIILNLTWREDWLWTCRDPPSPGSWMLRLKNKFYPSRYSLFLQITPA